MSNVLIFVEHDGTTPRPSSLAGITFGQQYANTTSGELHLALIGHGIGGVADKVKGYGAKTVHVIDHACFAHYLAESYTAALVEVATAAKATLIASAASAASKDLFPRLSGRLKAAMASDVLAIVDAKTFKRPMWAGNVIATVELTTEQKLCTVRATEFAAPATGGSAEVTTHGFTVDLAKLRASFVSLKEVKSTRPDLATARVVVSGGRGVKGPDGFKLVEQLADKLGAGVGASRAVCDAGWVANDLQVGQTGKVVAPDLYVAIGISGAIQHLAGMKGSKTIVAINKDPEAPIFQVADYGLVADLFKAVPELIVAL